MRLASTALSLTACAMIGACGGTDACHKPQTYQAAQPGAEIQAPEDLDDLQPQRRLAIPEASPAPPRPDDAPCLERPPPIQRSRQS